MRWHTKPITQLVVMFVVMSMVIGAQSTASALLTNTTQNKSIAKVENTELVNVQAGGCIDGDDAPLGDTYGMTPAEKANMLNRWPINGTPKDYYFGYDIFGIREGTRYTAIPLQGAELTNAITIRSMGNGDPKSENLLGSMFGYTPDKLKDAFDMKYPSGMGVAPDFIHGDYPGVRVPASIDTPIMAPNLPQYPIGGGFGAMVVYADTRKITLHIGRHEYVNTAFDNSSNCGGAGCRGGYWIYIENICVANRVLASYRNAYQNFQQNAQADKNPIKLPMVRPGQIIGKTTDATGVSIVVVDSGPIVAANDTHFWKAPVRPFSTGTPPAGGSPTAVPTNPPGGTPTTAPTAPPAGPTPGVPGCFFMTADVQNWQEAGKAKFNVSVKFNSAGGDGDIMLEKNDAHVAGWNGWNRNSNNPYVYGPEWTGGAIEVDPGQSVPVKFTGHVANSIACPGVRVDMNCTFNGDGACSCGGTSCQAFAPPTPTTGPTNTPVPPGTTTSPTLPPGTTPTPVTPIPGKAQYSLMVKSKLANLSHCSATLRVTVFKTGINLVQTQDITSYPYDTTRGFTFNNVEPGSYRIFARYGQYNGSTLVKDYGSSTEQTVTLVADQQKIGGLDISEQGPQYGECLEQPISPTPPAGGAPSPTITVGGNRLALIFAGSCDSNPLCDHLKALRNNTFNSLHGIIWINGSISVGDYLLGDNIGYTLTVGATNDEHRFLLTMHANLPPLSSWQDATMQLPGAAGSTYTTPQTYKIK